MPEGLTFAGGEGLGGFEVEQARRDDEVAGGGDGQNSVTPSTTPKMMASTTFNSAMGAGAETEASADDFDWPEANGKMVRTRRKMTFRTGCWFQFRRSAANLFAECRRRASLSAHVHTC